MQLPLPSALELAVAGAGAGALQLAVGYAMAVTLGSSSSPLRAIGRWLIDLMPGPMVDVSIALVESADKLLLFVTLALLWLTGASLATAAFGTGAGAAVMALIGGLGIAALVRRPEVPRLRAVVMGTTAALAGPAAVLFLPPPATLGAAASVLLLASVLETVWRPRRAPHAMKLRAATAPLGEPAPGTQFPVAGITPLLTPMDRFYVTDVTFPPPQVNPRTWNLLVTGLVARPLRLTFDELVAMPSVEVDATLCCVHNPVGGHRIGTARWLGVSLRTLLERAGVSPDADHLVAHSVDGFSGGLALSLLDRGFQPLVVYGMNGHPLPVEHGAPVRLLVPGIYGYDANVKWLERLELTRFELARDYWERRGWPRHPAVVKTQSRIDVPGPAAVVGPGPQLAAGVAWSPPRGVTRVELSVDGAPWQECELADELSPAAWRQWRCRWDATPGPHTLRVRAWGPDGVQPEGDGAPFPRGAVGHHLVTVTVTEHESPKRDRRGELAAAVSGRLRLARAGIRAWRAGSSDH